MKLEAQNKEKLFLFILAILILFGFYLCFIGGYGSDEDTLPMIYVFERRLADGTFVSSRFTSYPIPEIGLGFLSYFFFWKLGSKLNNLYFSHYQFSYNFFFHLRKKLI